jgi:hypothetical protein
MPISQNNRNILHSNGHLATLTVAAHPAKAASARVALMGNVTILWDKTLHDDEALSHHGLEECFLKRHKDAKWWIPGKDPAHTVCDLSSL